MAAVRNEGLALQYADEMLKRDQEIVIEAIKQNNGALRYACKELLRGKEFLLRLGCWNIFRYAPKEIVEDREFVLSVAKLNGLAVVGSNDSPFLNDKEILLEAVRSNGYALYYILYFASDALKKDSELMMEALKCNRFVLAASRTVPILSRLQTMSLNEWLNPTQNNNLLKYVFDWSEFICHTYPNEYEWLRKLKQSFQVMDIHDLELVLSNCPQGLERHGSMKLITLDNGSGKQVSVFASSRYSSHLNLQALVDENGEMLSVNEFAIATNVKTCDMSFTSFYFGWGAGHDEVRSEGLEWFSDQFSNLNTLDGKYLLFYIFEFIDKFKPEHSRYLCDHDSIFVVKKAMKDDNTHSQMFKKAHSFKNSLMKRENCLAAAVKSCKTKGVWIRLMKCGYVMSENQLGIDFNNFLSSTEHFQFFFDYCEFHHWRSFAEKKVQEQFMSILERKESTKLCQVIPQNNYSFPKELCCSLIQSNIELFDLIKKHRPDFWCPFDLRIPQPPSNTTLESTITSSITEPKILFLYQTYSDQKKFSDYFLKFSPRFKSDQYCHQQLPHQLATRKIVKEQFTPLLKKYDVVYRL
ncbi:hypothetical protein FDP41_006045 [Naegleria fowleri]|nr:uncharacterized protein FDP41_006045 [Naegleria fowleri]KAF0974940.1 hypothetical protein FDP41_006045 [Naegleria fowleri]